MTDIRRCKIKMIAVMLYIASPFIAIAASTESPISPSFDCHQASSTVEKTICSNKQLADLDVKLASIYSSLFSRLSTTDKTQLKKEQIAWLKNRDKAFCGEKHIIDCLSDAYVQRIDALNNWQSSISNRNQLSVDLIGDMGGEYWMVWVKEKGNNGYPIVYTADQLQAEKSHADENRFWLTKYDYSRRSDKYQQTEKKLHILDDIRKEFGDPLAGDKSWDQILASDNVADNYALNLPAGILGKIPKDHKILQISHWQMSPQNGQEVIIIYAQQRRVPDVNERAFIHAFCAMFVRKPDDSYDLTVIPITQPHEDNDGEFILLKMINLPNSNDGILQVLTRYMGGSGGTDRLRIFRISHK